MKLTLSQRGALRRQVAVVAGGLAAISMPAIAQEAAEEAVSLDKVEVTGSRIRRVDVETSSPVFTIDRSSIESSGVATLGELLQEMPSIAGAATNPQVNNGGGSGASTVSLRGLGSERTLVLLNGRRINSSPGISTVDVNAIPINMIERVEVLKDGASAIYGSDAIGGVVNFITRKDQAGTEILFNLGTSSRGDAESQNIWMTMGMPANNGMVLMGLNYENQESVSSGDRPFSKIPVALYNGEQISFGSSRIPNGNYQISRSAAESSGVDLSDPNCGTGDTVRVTRIDGAQGSSGADYRCYIGGGPNNDTYNFQTENLNVTPQERFGAFLSGEWTLFNQIGPVSDLGFFSDVLINSTSANFQIAPEPFDSRPPFANVVASADSVYNPFGEDISDLRLRMLRVGNRVESFTTNKFYVATGFNGTLFDEWFFDVNYIDGRDRMNTEAFGELFTPFTQDALGPSFRDENGVAQCGTPDAVIAGCIPADFFQEYDPNVDNQAAAFARLAPLVHDRYETTLKSYSFNITGDLMYLPAGVLGVAAGYEHREETSETVPDSVRVNGLISGNNSQPVFGSVSVDEFYAEAVVPLLADMDYINSLELSLGVRYSDYSTFGDTTNGKIGLQWRPVDNILVRSTYADVFRAPTINDLFGGQNDSAESYSDPCNGVTTAEGQDANVDAACQNVVRDGSFQQGDSQLPATVGGNPNLAPEEGDALTLGMVWSAPFGHEQLTVEVDAFSFDISNTIGTVGTNIRLQQCFDSGLFCDSFTRDDNGQVNSLIDVTSNVGRLETQGVDIGLRYDFGATEYGRFRWSLDSTWLYKQDNERIEGDPTTLVNNVGRFSESSAGGDGHYARWRALSALNWSQDIWSASWSARYIGAVIENPGDFGDPADPNFVSSRKVDAQLIHDLQFSLALDEYKTKLSLGIDNVTDELAPIIYSGFNGTTDVRTYDTVGTFVYLQAKMNFE